MSELGLITSVTDIFGEVCFYIPWGKIVTSDMAKSEMKIGFI